MEGSPDLLTSPSLKRGPRPPQGAQLCLRESGRPTTLHKIPAAVNAWVAPTSDPIPPGPPQSELQYDMDPTEHKPTDETLIGVRIKDPSS